MYNFIKSVSLIFSFFLVSESSAQSCIDSTLIDPEVMCSTLWEPVCGCNGVTYSNDCVATFAGGVVSFVNGECTGLNGDCIDLGNVDFGACDMAMGVALIGGSCQFTSGCGWEVDGEDYQPYFFESIDLCEVACDAGSDYAAFQGELEILQVFPNPSEGVVSVLGMTVDMEWKVYSSIGEFHCSRRGPCLQLELPRGVWVIALENGEIQRFVVR